MASQKIANNIQALTFRLKSETYAIDIEQIREVIEVGRITKVPRMPEYIKGVISLRGSGVPVADLNKMFGLGETKFTVNTCIIITEVSKDGEIVEIGALADEVEEVVSFHSDDIEDAPKFGTGIDNSFISGMAKRNEEFAIILDINSIFSGEEMKSASDTSTDTPSVSDTAEAEQAGIEFDLTSEEAVQES